MPWRACKQCQKKIFIIRPDSLPLEGYCPACYELVTGKCAECSGTGQIQRAHLGTMECLKCEGSGRART